MTRYRFAPQRVHHVASRLCRDHGQSPPLWLNALSRVPPSERIIRPAIQRDSVKKTRASRMFKPVEITYPEDQLRADFFGDHPWELARPRVVEENDGKDAQRCDWSRIEQPGKQLNGESVIQRQHWLMQNQGLSKPAAYDMARKEFYAIRHTQDVERRMAKEEALMTGAYFGKGPLEVGMQLEDATFEKWKAWAKEESVKRQIRQNASAGLEDGDGDGDGEGEDEEFGAGEGSDGQDEDAQSAV